MTKRYDLFEMWCNSNDGSTLQEWLTHHRIAERNLRYAQRQQRGFAEQMLAAQAQNWDAYQQQLRSFRAQQLYGAPGQFASSAQFFQAGLGGLNLGQIGGLFGRLHA